MNIAGSNLHPFPIIIAYDETAVFVNCFEYTTQHRAVDPHRNFTANSCRALEPALANVGKPAPLVPDAAVFLPGIGQRQKQRFRIAGRTIPGFSLPGMVREE